MTVIQTKYAPGKFGLGNEFAESEVPIEYSYRLVNRFINIKGHAEKIQGLDPLGDTISGTPTMTGLHEHIDDDGTATLMASENGNIWRLNETTNVWTRILTGKDSSRRLLSSQMGDKLIFWNGSDRNFYTDDGGNTFHEMKAIMQRGQGSSTSTSAAGLSDSNITSWLTNTFVTENDLVYNSTIGAYGIITAVSAQKLQHTAMGSAATGLGHPIITASANPASGDFYQVLDLVEMNIIEQNSGFDNFATGTSGTDTTGVYVSGVNWLDTEIRAGDIIYNTTRAAIAMVSAVTTAQITHTPIASQTHNDSFQFFKSAMPVADWVHVNYGRAYYIDSRQPTKVRISGPNDPQDMSTFERTLTAISQDYGSQQPQGEQILSLKTFQKYLVAIGRRNIFAFEGVDPIQDTSAKATDFSPVGLFPQGGMSRHSGESVGGAMTFIANDGLRNFAASFGNLSFQTANISEAIKSNLAAEIKTKASDPDEIQAIHYPRRNWLMCKVGDTIYNYNYTPAYSQGQIESSPYGSWSVFNSKLAQQKAYLVRRSGDLVCAGVGGKVYTYDTGHYEDDGDNIQTVLESGWLTMQEPQLSTQLKSGTYIRTQFEAGTPVTYTISVTGDFSELSNDTVIVTAEGVGQVGFAQVGSSPVGGSRILDQKLPLRWKGKQFKIRIETNDTNGPDIITGFTIYGNVLGKV